MEGGQHIWSHAENNNPTIYNMMVNKTLVGLKKKRD